VRRRGVPPRLAAPMTRALRRRAPFAIADAALDLQLQYRPREAVDRDRFALWARRTRIDARAGRLAAVRGDTATLTWIRDRIAGSLGPVRLARLDRRLTELESAVADDELSAVAELAATLTRAA
jgi:hypothetical protein